MTTKSCSKVAQSFYCEICDYTTCKKSSYEKHLTTDKHINEQLTTKILQNTTKSCSKVANKLYVCDCGKDYRHHSSLFNHKKKCILEKIDNESANDFQMLSNLVLEVVKSNTELQKQNQDFQKQMLDFCKNNNSITNSHNMTNSNNKAFNLQFFLNETCKDAMNISEFVDSLTLQLSDLENVGKLGFVEGMSNIIIENMKLLDISKRPIHCMDTKREVMYLKDQNTWEKTSDDDNKKIRRAIKQIATKNVKNLRLFKEKHPDCINYNSKYSDQYLKMQTESCGGKHPDYENESKIIKRLAKVMAVDKSL
jgi:hypothetical protein